MIEAIGAQPAVLDISTDFPEKVLPACSFGRAAGSGQKVWLPVEVWSA